MFVHTLPTSFDFVCAAGIHQAAAFNLSAEVSLENCTRERSPTRPRATRSRLIERTLIPITRATPLGIVRNRSPPLVKFSSLLEYLVPPVSHSVTLLGRSSVNFRFSGSFLRFFLLFFVFFFFFFFFFVTSSPTR